MGSSATTIKLLHAPVLIGGMRRSGTSLMRKILGSHTDVALLPTELRFFEKIYDGSELDEERFEAALNRALAFLQTKQFSLSRDSLWLRAKDHPKTWANLFTAILEEYRDKQAKLICGDKSPLYEFAYSEFCQWFEGTGLYFVHMVRNPIDCYASLKYLEGGKFKANIVYWCFQWNWSVSIGLKESSLHPQDYSFVTYEDLTANPNEIVEALCRKMGLKSQLDRMLAMADYAGEYAENSSFHQSERIGGGWQNRVSSKDALDRSSQIEDDERKFIVQHCGALANLVGYDLGRIAYGDFDNSKWATVAAKSYLDLLDLRTYAARIEAGYFFDRLKRKMNGGV